MTTPARFVTVDTIPIDQLDDYPGNARTHRADVLRDSVRTNGQYRAIVARRKPDGRLEVLAGHGTRNALAAEGANEVRVEIVDVDDDTARRIVLVDNRASDLAAYDDAALLAMLDEQSAGGWDGTGWDADAFAELLGDGAHEGTENTFDWEPPGPAPSLADRFLIPPFSVLDARQGWWRDRKRAWLDLGIRSEEGRPNAKAGGLDNAAALQAGLLMPEPSAYDPRYYAKKRAAEETVGRALTTNEFEAEHYDGPDGASGLSNGGTSVFDPVLCEISYRWFCPPNGTVLDPFAGGSVRGLVAGVLGRRYVGNDLRAEQITANEEQADEFITRGHLDAEHRPTWTIGDSAAWVGTLPEHSADLLFTCPPYLWLERYSDDPADLSTMSEGDFEALYRAILAGAARALRPDSFAVIVTGDVRDSRGRLVDFAGMTIRACEAAGLTFASDAVLVTPVGALPVRAARGFTGTRVLGRTHQDVLVFCKGDRKRATARLGDVDVTDALAGVDVEDD